MSADQTLVPLEQYRQQGCNIVLGVGSEKRLSPLYETRLIPMHVSVDLANSEVHYMGTKESDGKKVRVFALARPTIDTMGTLLGIDWELPVRQDDESRRDYCRIQQSGFIRRADGTRRRIVGTYSLDLEIVQADVEDQQAAKMASDSWKLPNKFWHIKTKTKEEQLAFIVNREMLQKRQNLERMCETGARLRALRSIGIKGTYTEAELTKNFVIGSVVYSPDRSDPEIAEAAKQAAIHAMDNLYGAQIETQEVPYEEVQEEPDLPVDESETEPGASDKKPVQDPASPGAQEDVPGELYIKLSKLAGSGFLTTDERDELVLWLDGDPDGPALEQKVKELEELQAMRSKANA